VREIYGDASYGDVGDSGSAMGHSDAIFFSLNSIPGTELPSSSSRGDHMIEALSSPATPTSGGSAPFQACASRLS
jgi:hypothetical protein